MRIERGVTRTVILTRRYAIKVPSARQSAATWTGGRRRSFTTRGRLWSITAGIRANLSEAEWSTYAGPTTVAPVLASWLGGLVNIYPRGRAVDEDDLGFDVDTWWPPLPAGMSADPKLANLALIAGHVVWVDYDQSQGDCHACRRYRHEQTTSMP